MEKILRYVICNNIRHNRISTTAVYVVDNAEVMETFGQIDKMPPEVRECAAFGVYIGSGWCKNDDGTITQCDYYKPQRRTEP